MEKLYKERINKLINLLEKNNMDAFMVQSNLNVLYLTGFYSAKNEAILIISKNKLIFITDGRFVNEFNRKVKGFELKLLKNIFSKESFLNEIFNEEKISSLMFDFDEFSYKNINGLNIDKENLIDVSNFLKNIRRIKTKEEINNIKSAAQIAEKAFENTIKKIKPGIKEIEIKNIINTEMLKFGSEKEAFSTIIGSGPDNGASPHAIPGERRIENGEFITIDFGATYKHYRSDITRTISLGKVNEEMIKIYNQTKKAKDTCVNMLKPGVKTQDVHNKAKEIINEIDCEFVHGLGHGIGLEGHELPVLNATSKEVLQPGDMHTVEPGIYIPGLCGVRIEDDYLITEDGYECLTPNITTELITI